MAEPKVTLTLNQQTLDLPTQAGTYGYNVIDIANVPTLKHYTIDPGFTATAACESKITYIDGEKGILLYRGYPIDQLANQCDYLETCYLLIHGELPNKTQHQEFVDEIKKSSHLHEQITKFFSGFRRDAHPMAIMVGVVGALSAFYHDVLDFKDPKDREKVAIRLIAKMPTIAAMCYKYSIGEPFMHPQNHLSYTENFLHMMFGTPFDTYIPDPALVKAMDRIFILHADHEQNASTTTVRVAGSTGANPFACISAGIGALWGPAHGGANEACLNMLKQIGDESNIEEYLKRAKDKNDPFRLMGFGHRVYKSYDPRAKVMQQACHEVLKAVGKENDPILKLALKLEKIALEDEYFIEKKLYPNVDFYSGITLSAIGVPSNMFTVIFALARTVGWISQWMEMISDPASRLCRPRQLYTGAPERDVVDVEKR